MLAILRQPTLQAAVSASKKPSTLKPVTQATCISCHDEENSENFQYHTFWPQIAHGSTWSSIADFWKARDRIPQTLLPEKVTRR